ncbi:hypothetical protein HDU93_004115, partial [Gonapodya sp. JEL0774]
MAFVTEQGANHSVFISDFPYPEDADKSRLSLNPRLQAKLRGIQLIALNTVGYSLSNNVIHYAVTSTSPAPLNWSQGLSSHRSWANSNLFGPCTVPDLNVVKYVILSQSKKGEKKLPYFTRQTASTLFMELVTL